MPHSLKCYMSENLNITITISILFMFLLKPAYYINIIFNFLIKQKHQQASTYTISVQPFTYKMCSLTRFELQMDARSRLPGSYRDGDGQHHGCVLSEVTQELIKAIGGQSLHHCCCHKHCFLAHDVISQGDVGGCAHITLQLRQTHKISVTYSHS